MSQNPNISNSPDLAREGGYVRAYQDRLAKAYLEIVREKDSALAGLVDQVFQLQDVAGNAVAKSSAPEAQRRAEKRQRMQNYMEFWENLDPERRLALAQEYAKIITLMRNARVIAVTDVVQAHNSLGSTTAGSIDFVLRRFREEGVAASQVQQFLNENAVAWFSLTGHPTNPATVDYSLAEIALTAIAVNDHAPEEDFWNALRIIRDIPIVGPHKTPVEEAVETLGTLRVIYHVAARQKALFDTALEKHGYAREGVAVRTPLIRPGIWPLGDGDGNPAMTAAVLRDGLALYRREIKFLYLANLEAAKRALPQRGEVRERSSFEIKMDAISATLNIIDAPDVRLPNLEGLTEQIGDLAEQLHKRDGAYADAASRLRDLAYRMSCFRFSFATIDIRHNAEDVLLTVARLLQVVGVTGEKDFLAMTDLERESALSGWLADESLFEKLKRIEAGQLWDGEDDDTGAIAARVYERLQVIGQNPDACEKLILAETTSAGQALAGLFLLKAAGNAVGTQKSRIDLVTLSESSADLLSLGRTLESLLENDTYRAHVVARGVLLAMIAKSDTTRQDGRGKAEFAQHEGAVTVYAAIDRMKGKYPELDTVLASVMNGGGLALQRGGGRVTEVPALHGRAAADARAYDMGPSTLTIQGHQQRILFAPDKTAVGTLEALASQNLYSKAGIQGEMPPPEAHKDINRQYARMDAWLYADMAGDAFDRLTKHNSAIDELLVRAPWLAMKAGNVSSRPGKRGEKLVGPGITPREAKGKDPKALQGRAISGERLVAHACLPVFTLLGLVEAMQAVEFESPVSLNPEKYGEPLHHLYKSHKIHRDGARVNINAAPIADFDIAWPLLTGRDRPEKEEVQHLARLFRDSGESGANAPDVTLAFLEDYFLEVEKLTFRMVTGVEPDADFRHGDGLKILWPDLAEQVEYRNRCSEFARVIEAHMTMQFDASPDTPLDETLFRTVQAIYTAADVIDAPTGILATRTRLDPIPDKKNGKTVFALPQSFTEKTVQDMLALPKWLR
jgi:phosphoenolpyruvate carboxylase